MSSLNVQIEEAPGHGAAAAAGAVVVRVVGDAGVVNAEALDQELSRLCARRPRLAVLDLSGVTFISSLGMGTLISFHRGLARHGGAVRLAAVTGVVAGALHRAQLDAVLPIFPTVDDALAAPANTPTPARA